LVLMCGLSLVWASEENDPALSMLEILEAQLTEDVAKWTDFQTIGSADMNAVSELRTRFQEMEGHSQTLISKEVDAYNRRQLEELRTKLQESLSQELERRRELPSLLATFDVDDDDTAVSERPIEPATTYATTEELMKTLNSESIFNYSDSLLSEWILNVMKEEGAQVLTELATKTNKVQEKVSTCMTPVNAANMVQQSIWNDLNSEMSNHAKLGAARIVYQDDMTSSTYYDPSWDESQTDWLRYMPQDWEALLPEGWKEWSIWNLKQAALQMLGSMGKHTAPPETILDSVTTIGSCWPMAGTSGQVTIRLPYPISVTSVSLHHVSLKVTSALNRDGRGNAAPRDFAVVGYPPCRGEVDCLRFGFDKSQPIELGTFEYKLVGSSDDSPRRSIQSFPVKDSTSTDTDLGGCAEPKATTCGGGGDDNVLNFVSDQELSSDDGTVIQGLRLFIKDNWGNDEYTCIYHVGVHGQQK